MKLIDENHKKNILFTLVCLLLAVSISAQEKYTLRGKIIDTLSAKPISNTSIVSKNDNTLGTITDGNGHFSLKLPAGKNVLIIQHLNYLVKEVEIIIIKDEILEWYMHPSGMKLDELVITSNKPKERLREVQIGVETVEVDKLLRIPTFFGQKDIIRSLVLLPGIKAESDVSSGFQVRGGTSSQNLILLDDAPIHNAGHVMGIFSVFNEDVVSSASLYKGLMGGEYGGGTSSVLDVSTNGGIKDKLSFSAGIGLLSSSIYLETPVIEDKMSVWLAGRRSYFDLFLTFSDNYKDNRIHFYDINAKVETRLSKNDRLSFSILNGRDELHLSNIIDMGWKNTASSTQWFHRYGKNLVSQTSLIFSEYNSDASLELYGTENCMIGFIHNYALKHDYDLNLENHKLKFGIQGAYVALKSGEWLTEGSIYKEVFSANDFAGWVGDVWKVSPKLDISGSIRLSLFSPRSYYLSKGEIQNNVSRDLSDAYFNLEPRLTLNYKLAEMHSVKGGYSRVTQNIHALKNVNMSLPFDRYTMTGGGIAPQIADQVSLGYMSLTNDNTWEFGLEAYFKHITGVLDYIDGTNFTTDIELENIILGGQGRSYGLEAIIKKNLGKFTGWAGYTLSWSDTRIEGINNGKWYTASNDRRHDLSLVGIYDIGKGWNLSFSWLYNTGQALTAPNAKYQIGDEFFFYYAERNGYRAPDYHRLDISFTHSKTFERYTQDITFGVYNAYNRHNPFMITFEEDINSSSGTKAIQTSLFGILPSISYSIKF